MHLRLTVAGLLTRDVVLRTLLTNYADRLQHGRPVHGAETAPCFIVPTWRVDGRPSRRTAGQVLVVEAHTARTDPRCQENLDAILRHLHLVLTDESARTSITARRLDASAGPLAGLQGTAVAVGFWEVAPAPAYVRA